MRLSEPRLKPLEENEWSEEQREVVLRAGGSDNPPNIFKTLVRHEKLLKRWTVFAAHVLNKSTFPEREREIAILRIGWLCRSGYEWGQHVVIGKRCGLTDEEIDRIAAGPDAEDWSRTDRAILRATDELNADAFISDPTWAELKQTYSDQQIMDLIFTVGNYNLVSMTLNTLGVQLEPGMEGFKLDVGS
ncbi:MAG: carboxymuconolactone decarboxylase family protein [Proteobacteria bacterium]|nr:carboxymuconolactone decarboxylase family protein [Pseudomonadota bacterium]